MKDNGPEDHDELAELRDLLMGAELEKLEQLQSRLESPERFSSEIGEVLPQAMRKSSQHGEELSEAMVPTVEEIVRLSIKKDINKFADALFPVIGPAIRKSIRETIRQMLQTLNQTLEQSLSWQGLRWRLESIRTGIPFAQIALLHGLVYQVEQVFLIHRETGLLLRHLSQDEVQNRNPDLVSSMLSAINDFVGDSFEAEANRTLDSIEVGELSIWIEAGPGAILALAIRGEAPNSLRLTMQQTLEQLQADHADDLIGFKGDAAPFEANDDLLGECLQAQYRGRKKGLSPKFLLVVMLLLAALIYWATVSWQQVTQRSEYIAALRAEPGYVVTETGSDGGQLIIKGLRDPLSRPPEQILQQSVLKPETVSQSFRPYQSLEPEFVAQRVHKILEPPPEVILQLQQNRLLVEGVADLVWRQRLSARLPLLVGIDSMDDSGLRTRFDATLLQPPPGVELELEGSVLYVTGAAGQDWLASLDSVAKKYPEIDRVDTRALVNLTESELVKEIQELERQAVFFDIATSFEFDDIDMPRISGLVKKIIALGGKLSRKVQILVRGYSDSVGSFEDNAFLSKERADYVAQALFNTGISPEFIAIRGLEQPVPPETSEAEKKYNRRVGFEVIVE